MVAFLVIVISLLIGSGFVIADWYCDTVEERKYRKEHYEDR